MSKTRVSDDIVLYNILPRLPTKSLIRFRCVCKSWDSFIRNPSFIHLRTLTNNNHTHHFLFLSPPHVFSVPFNPNHTNTNIMTTPPRPTLLFTLPNHKFALACVHCVNGLLCFYTRKYLWFSSLTEAFTLIANPTTKQVVTLPIDHSRFFFLATDFGYDPVGDKFKVLRLVKYYGCSHEFKIFTVGVDTSWRVVTAKTRFTLSLMEPYREYNNKRGLCVNGAIYWVLPTALLIFDVGSEQFNEMPLPSGYSYKESNYLLNLLCPDQMEIDGCLCLVEYGCSSLKLWILRDCKTQFWELKSIVIPCEYVYPLCRVPTTEILFVPYFYDGRVTGINYDMDTMSSRSVVIMEMSLPLWPREKSGDIDIFYCQESFRLLE